MIGQIVLFVGILTDVVATAALKASKGFSRPLPVVVLVVGYPLSLLLLEKSLHYLDLNIAYAIWAGVGTAFTVLVGVIFWREAFDLRHLLGVALIITGVVILNLISSAER